MTRPTITEPLRTERLHLDPLTPGDADEMVRVLDDPELHRFVGGEPPTLEGLRARYESQVRGSGDPGELWHNWIVRITASRRAIGFMQADVVDGDAELAWTIGVPWQGLGYASEAAIALVAWARASTLDRVSARIVPGHLASEAVAVACGLEATGDLDDDGEQLWERRLG